MLGEALGPQINGAHLLAEETRPSHVALQQPQDLRLASSMSHLDAPDLTRWRLSKEESLGLCHSVELSCRAEGICPFPTEPQAPIDGRIAGEQEAVSRCPSRGR